MRVTRETVLEEYDRVRDDERVPALINDVRDRLGPPFDAEVDRVRPRSPGPAAVRRGRRR